MANNPNVNKVVYGNQTVMDISDTTAEEGDVVSGKTFYKASGARSTGSAVIPDISNCYQTTDTAETDIQDADYFPFYDTSATAKRKTLWSNIKAKLKTYFDSLYAAISHTHTASQVSGLATVATSGDYDDLTDKPDLSVYAPLASPAFTGTPTAPTAVSSTNNTQIATTAFVQTAINGHKYPYLLIREGVTASAGSDVRIPASGTDSKIYPGLQSVYIPVAYSDTPIKFSQIKVHSGYLNITMAQGITNIDMGVMIIT